MRSRLPLNPQDWGGLTPPVVFEIFSLVRTLRRAYGARRSECSFSETQVAGTVLAVQVLLWVRMYDCFDWWTFSLDLPVCDRLTNNHVINHQTAYECILYQWFSPSTRRTSTPLLKTRVVRCPKPETTSLRVVLPIGPQYGPTMG